MCKITKNILLFSIFLFSAFYGHSQQSFDFAKAELELSTLFETLSKGENQHIRYNANEQFLERLKQTLAEKGAFAYPFSDVLCEKLTPKDNRFRLFNWAVRKDEGMEFFALMMVYNERKKNYDFIQLTDDSEGIFDLPNAVLDKEHWYGAYYTQVIQTEANGRTYYTLLGWNGNDETKNCKVIEVLTFKPNGEPVFGANIFTWKKEKFKRKVFEYSRKSPMILRYDYQAYSEPVGTPKPGQKPKEKLIKANMIVFDRLVPPNPEMLNTPEAYVAAGGVYDALVWLNGRWTLKTDILARNPEPPKSRRRTSNQRSGR